ncbi:MAG: rhomboid family intramembrane serine protease [Fibrobacteres bacterium]|nr:rhomboid family intramembrane serine protease [Fibrobacterota bacterium]
MFPLRDENPTVNKSLATFLIIAGNILSWILIQSGGSGQSFIESIFNWGLIPGEILSTVPAGVKIPVGDGLVYITESSRSPLTLITSMFMHGGWMHILGNMWFLYIFGDNVEDIMGPFRFVVFYILCGLAAALAQMIADPYSTAPMVGASGAIGGVMGGYALLFPKAPVHVFVFFVKIVVPAIFMLGYWFILQLISGSSAGSGNGGVAFWAHVGGFICGIVLVKFFSNKERLSNSRNKKGRTSVIISRTRR